jgi:DNA topoisomerase-3
LESVSVIDKLFIAEKSSLAEEVAKAWAEQTGRTATRSSGKWTVGDDEVLALSGHVYQQAEPQEYNVKYASWNVDDLPIVPARWVLVPVKDKVARIKEVRDAIKDARTIVNVGDAGREGQLLVDEVLVEAKRDPFAADVLRLWVKSLARKDMLEALSGMFPNVQKKTLYESAVARQRADWLHGMNMTRLYTSLARRSGADKLLSVGRVQTPTLRLVVDRDREIAKFRAVDHFLPTGVFRHAGGSFRAAWVIPADHEGTDSDGRLVDKSVAEKVLAKVAGKTGPVESFEVKRKSKAPPLPYALSNLQKECSAKFGLSAAKTLEVAQSLYEKKVTTYPRSDSQYLPNAILQEAPGILDNLAGMRDHGELAKGANRSIKTSAWNDAKVSDHHAIIPTSEATQSRLDELSDIERKVFDLVAKVFIAQFYPDHRWDSTTAIVAVERERFRATGRRIAEQGWKVVYGAALEKEDDENEDEQAMPVMAKGDPVLVEKTTVEAKRTTPPAHFTEGTLIDAMKNVHRFVPDSDVKKKLKESSGIGTEATRSNILETLKDKSRGFLVPKGKFIVSTPVGQSLIDVIHAKLTDPAMTALWEDQLDKVTKGDLSVETFLDVLVKDLTATVKALAGTTLKIAGAQEPLPGTGELCPKCGKGRLRTATAVTGDSKGKRFLSCDAYRKEEPDSCRYSKWPEEAVKPLPGDGNVCPKCGKGRLRTRVIRQGDKKGERFLSCDAYDASDEGSCRYSEWAVVVVEPLPGDGAVCPKCGKGRLKTRLSKAKDRYLSCDNWRKDDPSACDYFDWGRPKVEPLPGDGSVCPKCGKGHLKTRSTSKGARFLSCDNWRKDDKNSCDYSKWDDDGRPPRQAVEPLPGDGDACPKCRKGHMRTRMSAKGSRFLSCDGWRKEDPKSCNNAMFFDDDGKPKADGPRADARPARTDAKPAAGGGARPGVAARGRPGSVRR